ncbi:hypothetical protein LRS06_12980 [Hymenobacter sp. J193]|uniref:hypothetical protein n=1 Tax=Hymenobacter sp. J193 TaxID=2898429 RepID=UPI0021509683|nr:hypothetical protein [Hymenobacter sp. J193]MCR5888663.1 hypothetical protein [Hymenobacter sp. J193]
MDEIRKAAYRHILYQFLLDVRTEPVPLMDDERAIIKGKYAGPVAYQLHNLALASVNDFVDFDESHFWASINGFNQRNPDTTILHFRVVFERFLRSKQL